MTTKPLKILVSGDVEGRFDQLFARINSIQKKAGTFDLLLCVGNFFGTNTDEWQKYAAGRVKVPVPTLVLGPNKPEHAKLFSDNNGEELCENVTYLGKKGLYTGSSGLHLAYLSGIESDIVSDSTNFTAVDITSLTAPVRNDSHFRGVDILITSQWPKAVEKYASDVDSITTDKCGSECIAQLAMALKPRYHLCGLEGVFYERQPYRNHQVLAEPARHVTRFIALAKVGNIEKEKYIYAFNVTPLSKMDATELVSQPDDVTECPYQQKKWISAAENQDQQFFYDMKGGPGGKRSQNDKQERQQKKPRREQPVPTGPCWFCLGSPEVEKHLVVSVGTECYLALAKGGLVDDHTLILPIGHYQSSVAAPEEVLDEVNKYKRALKKCFKKQNKTVVFFERNYKTQHLQIQVIPIPMDSVQEVKEMFLECADGESIDLNEIPEHSDIRQIAQVGVPYFYAELPTGEKMFHRIKKNFPLQFGREVCASPGILNMPERVDWKMCSISKSREEQLASDFKSTFRTFDFALDS